MPEFEIYLRDLKPSVQREVLRFFKLKSAEEGNFDVMPLFMLTK